mmetsp:Transcript_28268/g.32510  ORF Transcript_28268/g.32510 Transcript_28268/m.32510 type:complete len:243 (-) Transcript_28268:207-935(-)
MWNGCNGRKTLSRLLSIMTGRTNRRIVCCCGKSVSQVDKLCTILGSFTHFFSQCRCSSFGWCGNAMGGLLGGCLRGVCCWIHSGRRSGLFGGIGCRILGGNRSICRIIGADTHQRHRRWIRSGIGGESIGRIIGRRADICFQHRRWISRILGRGGFRTNGKAFTTQATGIKQDKTTFVGNNFLQRSIVYFRRHTGSKFRTVHLFGLCRRLGSSRGTATPPSPRRRDHSHLRVSDCGKDTKRN